MSNNVNNIAEKIKKYRKVKNMSQEMLANASGINVSMIKKYECGLRNPKPEQLLKIANALGISINALYSHKINTVSDVITLLINLDEQTALNITGEKDDTGRYIEDSICLSFDDDTINESLSKYLAYKERINSIQKALSLSVDDKNSAITETNHHIDNLIASDAIIKRPGPY